jgi:integrase
VKRVQRHQQGSIVFDRRRKTWNFLQWVDGKRHTKVIGPLRRFPTKASAWRAAEAILQPTTSQVQAITVNMLVEKYRLQKMPQRYSTRRAYEVWLRLYILPKWGDSPITALQPMPVEVWLKSLPLAPRSKAGIRCVLRLLWDFAQWSGSVPLQRNPMELVTIKNATKRVRQPRSLTVQEFHNFIALLNEPFRTIALVSLSFGLRISECLALRWSDIDWLNANLYIQRAIVRQRLDEVKTSYSARSMPIDGRMLELLKVWKQASQFAAADDWLFASPAKIGRLPWSADAVNDAYLKAAKTAGIGHVSTHTMRHTFRSWLDATGASITVQKSLMRHSSIKTTLDVYGTIVTDEMTQATTKVTELALNGLQTDCSHS